MRNVLQQKINELADAVENMRQVVFQDLVTWDYLSLMPVGETVKIGNTTNTKLLQEDSCIIFKTVIPPGEVFPLHWHDFKEENLVIYGEVENSDKIYNKGFWMKIDPYEAHSVKNNTSVDSCIIVVFTK